MNDSEDIKIESNNLKDFLKKLLKKYPDICPHKEDDWDWTWADDGFDSLEIGDYLQAEYMFEQLIVSQPDYFEGYEGLALVYQAEGKMSEAILLIDHAVKLANRLFKKDGLDREALNDIIKEQRQIHEM
ncbi:MAG: hypothetical protein PHR77_18310 [Kiritimatiellae bacterium]|nr:hypothetical protein [Kiritimatiellia bacterium]MDD5521121.1 hypothetical protein [Kiritimatiellia bacterium]